MTTIINNNINPNSAPLRETCCAIIVTYNPDQNIKYRLDNINQQFPNLVIVDNASLKASIKALQEFSLSHSAALILNECNMGIAHALNQGMDYAKKSGFEWVLCLDQDSIIKSTLLADLRATWQKGDCLPAVIGCNYINTHKKTVRLPASDDTGSYIDCKTIITSGTLMPLCIPEHIGKFREDYFIDSVDHEYCLRARKYGYSVRLCKAIGMSHSIGSESTRSLFGYTIAHVHPPIRKYYIARNTLLTIKTYFTQEPLWSLRQTARLGIELISILILEKNKNLKLKAFLTGLYHAFKNHTGQLNAMP